MAMEDLGDKFFQIGQYDKTKTEDILRALAKFHAHFWNNPISRESRGSFWVLNRRPKKGKHYKSIYVHIFQIQNNFEQMMMFPYLRIFW